MTKTTPQQEREAAQEMFNRMQSYDLIAKLPNIPVEVLECMDFASNYFGDIAMGRRPALDEEDLHHLLSTRLAQREAEIAEAVGGLELPYAYERKSPFPGEAVDYHLKKYGHLPELGCCRFDQMNREETDAYNKAVKDALSLLTPSE